MTAVPGVAGGHLASKLIRGKRQCTEFEADPRHGHSEPVFSQQDIEADLQVVLLQDLVNGVVFDLFCQTQDVRQISAKRLDLTLQSRDLV